MKKTTTWLVVGDRSRARIFAAEDLAEPWRLVDELDHPAGRAHAVDLVTDQQGEVRQSGTGTRVSMDASTDPTVVELERFARALARRIQQGFDEHDFEDLILVAAPRFLGRLRQELGDPVRRRVRTEIDKDYTPLDESALHARLAPQLT